MAMDKDFMWREGDVVSVLATVRFDRNARSELVFLKAGSSQFGVSTDEIERVVQPKIEVGDTVAFDHPTGDYTAEGVVLALTDDRECAWVQEIGYQANRKPHTIRLGDCNPVRDPPAAEEPAAEPPAPPAVPLAQHVAVDDEIQF